MTVGPAPITLAIHGGAGTITRASLTREAEAQFRAVLARALLAGHALLASGGSSLDAVIAAITVMEDDPLFNAGKGAVFTHDGRNELDASIMDGASGRAGGVAGVLTVRNPIVAARAVMERSPHVLLSGAGADRFAAEQQLEIVDPSYFFTEHRWKQLQHAKARNSIDLDHDGKYGTVGAVALDCLGNLAAGTSTGGLTNKRFGRVGDSPLIGAGTYADNATAAISGTGTGEFFMRGLVAYDIAARIKYQGLPLAAAVEQTLCSTLDARGGQGGVIALDARGEVKFGFNTEGMYRGVVRADGAVAVSIYR